MALSTDRLDSELWFLELSEFIEECEGSSVQEVERILRRFVSLQTVGPAQWASRFEPTIGSQRFEELLGAAAYESAAIGLLGRRSGYMLSRSAMGDCVCSVWLHENSGEYHARSSSEGIALVAAIATAILSEIGKEVDILRSAPPDHFA